MNDNKEISGAQGATAVDAAGQAVQPPQRPHDVEWCISFMGGEIILQSRSGDRSGSVSAWEDGDIIVAVSGKNDTTQVAHEKSAHRALQRLGAWLGVRDLDRDDNLVPLPPHDFASVGCTSVMNERSESSGSLPSASAKEEIFTPCDCLYGPNQGSVPCVCLPKTNE